MIVLLIKIVIEEYINHITPYHFKLAADPAPFKRERWYRPNWMAIEFNLLYRWHGADPVAAARRADLDDDLQPGDGGRARARGADRRRLAHARPAASALFNTDPALREVELASIREARVGRSWRRTTTTASWRASRA